MSIGWYLVLSGSSPRALHSTIRSKRPKTQLFSGHLQTSGPAPSSVGPPPVMLAKARGPAKCDGDPEVQFPRPRAIAAKRQYPRHPRLHARVKAGRRNPLLRLPSGCMHGTEMPHPPRISSTPTGPRCCRTTGGVMSNIHRPGAAGAKPLPSTAKAARPAASASSIESLVREGLIRLMNEGSNSGPINIAFQASITIAPAGGTVTRAGIDPSLDFTLLPLAPGRPSPSRPAW